MRFAERKENNNNIKDSTESRKTIKDSDVKKIGIFDLLFTY